MKAVFFLFHGFSNTTDVPMQISDERSSGPEDHGLEMRSKSSASNAIANAPPVSDDRSQGTLTKREIAHTVYSANLGVSRREAKELIDAILEEIVSALVAGEEVSLRGFGKFAVRQKRERPGRNPKTGVSAPISARRDVTFKASEILKNEASAD
jgi:integration host factor subunit alpha